jgi:membrane protein DedA with SNARE-associated domain
LIKSQIGCPTNRVEHVLNMQEFIIKFGYPALFLGALLEGESVLIAAGFLAKGGYLNLYLVMLVALLGTYTADVSIYFLGRKKGEGVISRLSLAKAYYPKVKALFEKYGIWAIFITRYLYGLRLASAGFMGLIKMRKGQYLPFNFLSCAIWSILVGGLGYLFGASLEVLIGQVKQYERVVVVFIIFAGVSMWLARRIWIKKKNQKA